MPNTEISLTPSVIHPWVAEGQQRVRFGISIFPQPAVWHQFINIVQRDISDNYTAASRGNRQPFSAKTP